MANGKFWILLHNGNPVKHSIFHAPWACLTSTISPVYTDSCNSKKYAHFKSLRKAEEAASKITKKHGGDVCIMEAVALATVPTTIVKIEGLVND